MSNYSQRQIGWLISLLILMFFHVGVAIRNLDAATNEVYSLISYAGFIFVPVQIPGGETIYFSDRPVSTEFYLRFCSVTGRSVPRLSAYPDRFSDNRLLGSDGNMKAVASFVSLHDSEAFCDFLSVGVLEPKVKAPGVFRLPTKSELLIALKVHSQDIQHGGIKLWSSTPAVRSDQEGSYFRPYVYTVSKTNANVRSFVTCSLSASGDVGFLVVMIPKKDPGSVLPDLSHDGKIELTLFYEKTER